MRGRIDRVFLWALSLLACCGLAETASADMQIALKDRGLEADFGIYAPRGDCKLEPRITVGDSGFVYRANGRTLAGQAFVYAASYWGPDYRGISSTFFAFPKSDNDFGTLTLSLAADEQRGKMVLEANLGPGQRLDPFQAALVKASPLLRCKGTEVAVAPAPKSAPVPTPIAVPLDWSNLAAMTGKYKGEFDLFDAGPIAAAIRALIGSKIKMLEANLDVSGPLGRTGDLFYLSGNAPHRGGEDQAYVLIDSKHHVVQVGLWDMGRLTVSVSGGKRLPVPADIRALLNQSPPEGGVAAPGKPWEVVPVEGRTPLAYVDAAASPSIKSFSIFCDHGRPLIAMLLGKPATSRALTVSWVFSGRVVNVPMVQGNNEATFWQGSLTGSPLLSMLMNQSGFAYLRINSVMEGQALLTGSTAALRTALKTCT